MKSFGLIAIIALLFLAACSGDEIKIINIENISTKNKDSASKSNRPVADAQTILSKKEVPVLCYHRIRNFKHGGGLKDYEVTPAAFAEQMQALADSGYTTILPGQLYNYLTYAESIPEKPVMITFDDTHMEQFTIGTTELNKHGFKGVYFLMTISIGRPRYMSREQIKQLADEGHEIAGHTWDHQRVTVYNDTDWDKQFTEANKKIEIISGKPVEYFAYPFGLWNKEAILKLKHRGVKLSFQLSAKRDSTEPLYSIRRMLVPGTWSTAGLLKAMKTNFR